MSFLHVVLFSLFSCPLVVLSSHTNRSSLCVYVILYTYCHVYLGWRPRRSIVFGSWGAGEYGFFGTTEYVEEYLKVFEARAVAHLNVDLAIIQTYNLLVSATPLLHKVIKEATKKVRQIEGLRTSGIFFNVFLLSLGRYLINVEKKKKNGEKKCQPHNSRQNETPAPHSSCLFLPVTPSPSGPSPLSLLLSLSLPSLVYIVRSFLLHSRLICFLL